MQEDQKPFPYDFLSRASSQCCYFRIIQLTPSINILWYILKVTNLPAAFICFHELILHYVHITNFRPAAETFNSPHQLILQQIKKLLKSVFL